METEAWEYDSDIVLVPEHFTVQWDNAFRMNEPDSNLVANNNWNSMFI